MNTNMISISTELEKSIDQYRVVCLSTGHVTDTDREVLEDLARNRKENMIMGREYGWFIKLYEDEATRFEGVSEHVHHILDAAFNAGFRMVEFDRDAKIYNTLPTFNW